MPLIIINQVTYFFHLCLTVSTVSEVRVDVTEQKIHPLLGLLEIDQVKRNRSLKNQMRLQQSNWAIFSAVKSISLIKITLQGLCVLERDVWSGKWLKAAVECTRLVSIILTDVTSTTLGGHQGVTDPDVKKCEDVFKQDVSQILLWLYIKLIQSVCAVSWHTCQVILLHYGCTTQCFMCQLPAVT